MSAGLDSLALWLVGTPLALYVNGHAWVWPACETLHFMGLTLLVGMVGLFDLRILGFAAELPLGAAHKLVPLGVAGFVVNVVTGLVFVVARPEQYVHNPAFGWKLLFLGIAGLNVILFNRTVLVRTLGVGPGGQAPTLAKAIAGTSLFCWFAVLYFGRMLPFLGDAF
jgi:hypothetical protein